jgi:outer membrane protein, heavy metal efflux system
MKMKMRFCLALLGLWIGLVSMATGCASTSPKPAYNEVSKTIADRSGYNLHWNQNTELDAQAQKAVDQLLAKKLTAESSVQLALLNNPGLRSTLEDLSIAQADLVQAGLLKNPSFGVGISAWEQEHINPNLFFTIEQEFLDILTLPMRKRVAAAQLEAVKLRVSHQVLMLASEVRQAFYTAQAAAQMVQIRKLIVEAAEASAALAKRQHQAGNMNDLAINVELGLASQMRLDWQKNEREAIEAREKLTRLLGLWGKQTSFQLAPSLLELPKKEGTLAHLETVALQHRLDIQASRREVQSIEYTLSLAKTTRWTGFINIEVEAARLRGENRIAFGPKASMELPLFDQRQAAIARLEALRRISNNQLQSLAIEVRSDVRAQRAKLLLMRSTVEEYAKVLVPIRENIVKFSQQQYNAMLLGVYQLIAAKQNEFSTYQEYIEALRDYWIARSDLERMLGVRLSHVAGNPKAGKKSE